MRVQNVNKENNKHKKIKETILTEYKKENSVNSVENIQYTKKQNSLLRSEL